MYDQRGNRQLVLYLWNSYKRLIARAVGRIKHEVNELGLWHQVALVYQPEGRSFLYLDGHLVGSNNLTFGYPAIPLTELRIGEK